MYLLPGGGLDEHFDVRSAPEPGITPAGMERDLTDIQRPTGVLVLVVIYIILGVLRFGEAALLMMQDFSGSGL